jgi:hypothetical protein
MEGVMARAKKAAGLGHNSTAAPLSDDDVAALLTFHQLKILEGQRKLDALLVDVKSARDIVNGAFKRLTADTQVTRKDFETEVLAKLNMTEAEYLASERKRTRLHKLSGLKQGEQISLLDAIEDTVDEALTAEANGYRAGRRADDPVVPKTLNPIFHPDWMRGWDKGQQENIMALTRADTILAERAKAPKAGEMVADAEDEGDGDDDQIDLEDEVAAQMKALKDSGWADDAPTPPKLEEANGGKTVRTPKGSHKAEARTFADPGLEPVY